MNDSRYTRRLPIGGLKIGKPAESPYAFSGRWVLGSPFCWMLLDTSIGIAGSQSCVLASGFSPVDIFTAVRDTVPSSSAAGVPTLTLAISKNYYSKDHRLTDTAAVVLLGVIRPENHVVMTDNFRAVAKLYSSGHVFTFDTLRKAISQNAYNTKKTR